MTLPPTDKSLSESKPLPENQILEEDKSIQKILQEIEDGKTVFVDPDVADFMGLIVEDALSQDEAMLSTLPIDPETDRLLDEEEVDE